MKKTCSFTLAVLVLMLSLGVLAEASAPIVEEPLTITVAVQANGYNLLPWSEKAFYKAISEQTNVNFEWNELNDWATQTNLLVASGSTPDLIMGSINANTLEENREMFWELSELIEQYAPSLSKVFEEEPSVLAFSKSSDGGIYKLPTQFTFNLDNAIGTMFWINQKWLDAVGMENPKTIEELEAVLTAFKEKDPNGNGIADEIPLSMQETGWAGKFSSLFGTFGVLYDTSNYVDSNEEGQVYFQPSQDEFYQALVWLNDIASRGLLDKESFSQTGDQFNSKISQNILGIVAKYNPQNFLDGFVPLNIIEGPNEITLYEGLKDSTVANYMLIPKTFDKPEIIVKLYEYINADFTKKLSNRYGEEGVYWKYTGNGNDYVLSDYDSAPPEGFEFWDQYVYTHGETGNAGFSLFSKADLAHNVSPKTVRESGILSYQPYFPAVSYQAGPVSAEDASERSLLFVELDAYVQSFVADAIFGSVDETSWQNHLNTLQNLQVNRYVELCQAAFDAYRAQLGD